MRLRFFTIPTRYADQGSDEVNAFLASHRVVSIDRQLVVEGGNSFWALCVTYDEVATSARGGVPPGRREKIDYREVLSPPEFAVFARLRGLRKTMSEAESVPAFALFSNEQLAEIVRRRVTSLTALAKVEGVGDARVAKYGEAFVRVVAEAELPPASSPDAVDEA